MAFNRPTLSEINERVEAEITGTLGVTNLLRRAFIKILSKVLSGISHLWHGHLDYNSKQFLPTTMDEANLIEFGGIWNIPRKEAVAGIYNITVTGVDGTTIPANTIFKRSDNLEYFTQEAGLIVNGSALLKIVSENVGIDSELEVGAEVLILNPIASVNSDALVSSVDTEPEDIETLDLYRSRIITRIQGQISGGTATDYIQWAQEVSSVTRSWVLPENLGAGTVGVTFVEDGEDPIIPSIAKVEEVRAYIDERRPVGANVSVFAPILFPINLTIELKPNTTEVQSAITGELKDLLLRDAALEGAYKSASENFTGKILISKINEAISLAVGEEDHKITLINGSTPSDITPPTNNLITLGEITWLPLA